MVLMIIEGKTYYTARELADKVGASKTYICRLAKQGRIRHEHTQLGYLFPEETAEFDWANRKGKRS